MQDRQAMPDGLQSNARTKVLLLLLKVAATAFLYYAAARASLFLAFEQTNVSPVWPPSGVAFALALLWSSRIWPGIWLGAFAANAAVFLLNQFAPVWDVVVISSLIAVGNTLEAVVGYHLFQRFLGKTHPLACSHNVFVLMAIIFAMCLVSAFNGPTWLCLLQFVPWNFYWVLVGTWWIGDAAGILVVLPIFLSFWLPPTIRWTKGKIIEALIFGNLLLISNLLVFGGQLFFSRDHWPLAFVMVIFMVLGVFRLRDFGAAVTLLITFGAAVWGTLHSVGPFGHLSHNEALILVELFVALLSVTGLLLSATLHERDRYVLETEKSRKRFETVIEFSPYAIVMVNRQGKIELVNQMAERLFFYPRAELLGRSLEILLPERFRSQHKALRQHFVESPETRPMGAGRDLFARCRDGTEIPVEIGLNPIQMEGEIFTLASIVDITERKKAERALQASEAYFRTMADNAPVMIWMSDREGAVTFFNKSWLHFTGQNIEHEIGTGWTQNIHPDDRARCLETRIAALRCREKLTMDYRMKRHDGQYRWILETAAPFFRLYEEFVGYIGTCVDVTQLKQAQEVLARDKNTLTRIVDERSRELNKTRKELEQTSRLADIGTLAATVAHELRNPLSVIQMASFNLKRKYSGDKHLANIEKKVEEGNQIINNLLNYARIKKPSFMQVPILEILEECLSLARMKYETENVTVRRKYEVDPSCRIEADPLQIKEVLHNIINNAFQSLQGAERVVTLTVREEGTELKISVLDTGIGISQTDLSRIFQPFFTRKSKGTGLGLTICNEIIHLHDGKIEIESVENRGTEVKISLPIRRNSAWANKS